MGTSKALLDAGGRTFVERVVAALARGGCGPVLTVVRDPAGAEARAARRAGARVVANPDPSEGPISSLRTALRALDGSEDAVAFLPVDHPLVKGRTVEELLAAFRDGGAVAVLPVHDGRRGHPVLLSRALFPELLEGGLDEGARTVLRRHAEALREVEVDDPGILADIDDPAAYRRHVDPAGPGGPDR
ncbi:MAG: nucleotidyltransferase family protein [Gemmatimonadetes bacterium]|nr:nucleotidyltransferase family protein [Gemmatimonadota bacterium]